MVSTSTGRLRCSFGIGLLNDLLEAADDLFLRARQAVAKFVEEIPNSLPALPCLRLVLRTHHQIVDARCVHPCVPRAGPPPGLRSGVRRRSASPSASAASVVRTPSADHLHARQHSGSERPRAPARDRRGGSGSALPCTSARDRRDPVNPESVSRCAPAAHASRAISARPRVMSPACALCPRPSPSATPAAMAMTFFKRAANFDADDIARSVQPKVRRAEIGLHGFHHVRIRRRDADGRRQLARHLGRKAWSRQHTDANARAEFLLDDLGGTEQRVLFRVPWPH